MVPKPPCLWSFWSPGRLRHMHGPIVISGHRCLGGTQGDKIVGNFHFYHRYPREANCESRRFILAYSFEKPQCNISARPDLWWEWWVEEQVKVNQEAEESGWRTNSGLENQPFGNKQLPRACPWWPKDFQLAPPPRSEVRCIHPTKSSDLALPRQLHVGLKIQ